MNSSYFSMGDTIVAPATAIDRPAALAVIRLSGGATVAILERIFRPIAGELPSVIAPRVMTLGTIVDVHGEPLDQALVVRFEAGKSFTGEECAELHLHGSPAVARAVLDVCVAAGARLATPGEFTRRAFLNGKLDLAQAEAVADLTSAEGAAARGAALRQLRGGLSQRVANLRDRLLDVAAEVECRLDWPDDEVEQIPEGQLAQWIGDVHNEMNVMLEMWRRSGRAVRDGARVVLVGKPNVGKSSLFNALVGRERAIVTPHAGTTRDTLEAKFEMGGIVITLIDTAGLRHADEAGDVERLGIERSKAELETAELILFVADATAQNGNGDGNALREEFKRWRTDTKDFEQSPPVIFVLNKCDLLDENLKTKIDCITDNMIPVCATDMSGLEQLEQRIVAAVAGRIGAGCGATDADLVTNTRHAMCIEKAADALNNALATLDDGEVGALLMVDISIAVASLNEVLGLDGSDDLLDRVFGKFCLGK